jgi:putative transposase
MQEHISQWSVGEMAKALGISRSGYYQFIKRTASKREQENECLLKEIKIIHQESRETDGSPRIQAQLRLQGILSSRKRVARLMKQEGIESKRKNDFESPLRLIL